MLFSATVVITETGDRMTNQVRAEGALALANWRFDPDAASLPEDGIYAVRVSAAMRELADRDVVFETLEGGVAIRLIKVEEQI